MHAEPTWLPTTGKKTVAATDDRLCQGDFLQTIEQILIFIRTAILVPRCISRGFLPVIISHYDSLLMCQVT